MLVSGELGQFERKLLKIMKEENHKLAILLMELVKMKSHKRKWYGMLSNGLCFKYMVNS